MPTRPLSTSRKTRSKDFLSRKERSALMSRIRGKNTSIELTMFGLMRSLGLKFRKHVRALPGCPDILIPDRKVAVFLDGDFWHGRRYESYRRRLAPAWRTKIEANIARDRSNRFKLRRLGWRVVRLWGKDIQRSPEQCVGRVTAILAESPVTGK